MLIIRTWFCFLVFNFRRRWFLVDATERCSQDHPQQKFCRSDFVLKGTIKFDAVAVDGDFVRYSWSPRTQFKISPRFTALPDAALESIYIRTTDVDRFQWSKGKKLIISGRVLKIANVGAALFVSSCDWMDSWDHVTHRQRSFLHKKLYERNCDCETSWRGPEFCGSPKQRTSFLNGPSSMNTCFTENSYCSIRPTKTGGGFSCVWAANRDLKHCLAQAAETTI